jgi:AMMECR1 domain-containing protein
MPSALQDRRFEPMAHREVAALSCTVSLLCAFERAASWQDWSIGVHGLIIEFFGALQALANFPVALYIIDCDHLEQNKSVATHCH